MHEAARAAGLPEGAIGWMTTVTLEGTQELMKHRAVAVILATGGMGLVPLRWLARELAAIGNEVHLLIGARSWDDLPLHPQSVANATGIGGDGVLSEVVCEDRGEGLVTQLLARRLPSLLAAGGTLLLVHDLARRLAGREAALAADVTRHRTHRLNGLEGVFNRHSRAFKNRSLSPGLFGGRGRDGYLLVPSGGNRLPA